MVPTGFDGKFCTLALAYGVVESVGGALVVTRCLVPRCQLGHESQPDELPKEFGRFDNVPLRNNLGGNLQQIESLVDVVVCVASTIVIVVIAASSYLPSLRELTR